MALTLSAIKHNCANPALHGNVLTLYFTSKASTDVMNKLPGASQSENKLELRYKKAKSLNIQKLNRKKVFIL